MGKAGKAKPKGARPTAATSAAIVWQAAVGIAGFAIYSPDVEPQSFTVFYGKSFSEKIAALTAEITDNTSSIKSAEDSYQKLTSDIQERLDQLEVREKLISERYTEQFGKMEQSMTQFNSTKTLLENFIEAWKKQK